MRDKFCIPLTAICLLYLACGNSETTDPELSLGLTIVDSIAFDYDLPPLEFADNLDDRAYLFYAITQDSLHLITYRYPERQTTKFAVPATGPDKFGGELSSVGFLDTDLILVISTTKMTVYDPVGNTVRTRYLENHSAQRMNKKLVRVPGEELILTMHEIHSQTDGLSGMDPEFWRAYRMLSAYDHTLESKGLFLNVEEQSPLIDPGGFKNSRQLFDQSAGKLYVNHNPDPTIYVYDLSKDYPLIDRYPIQPEHYNRENPGEEDIFKALLTSGTFHTLVAHQDTIILGYFTGIPAREYRAELHNPDWTRMMFRKFSKNYAIIMVDGKRVAPDVLLPRKAGSLVSHLPDGNYLLTKNSNVVEPISGDIFYVAKLIDR